MVAPNEAAKCLGVAKRSGHIFLFDVGVYRRISYCFGNIIFIVKFLMLLRSYIDEFSVSFSV